MTLIATVHGNGPYRPVVCYNGRLYVIGNAFADAFDALREATGAIERIRDGMRSPGYEEILDRMV
jgi:hypothetical protein